MPFMSELHRKLQIGGRLILATNIPIYGEEAQTKLTDQGLFELETCEQIGFDSPGRTHFEKRYLARREVCMNYVFRKSTLQ
jgi:tRNA (guanine-N7-)-methyltransferase